MFIKQISVYLENDKGTLREMTRLLADHEIDLVAITLADTATFGIARLIMRSESMNPGRSCLEEAGFVTKINDVLCLRVPNRPAELDRILAILEENGYSLEYLYSLNYSVGENALLILRLSDNEGVEEILEKEGIEMCAQSVIDELL